MKIVSLARIPNGLFSARSVPDLALSQNAKRRNALGWHAHGLVSAILLKHEATAADRRLFCAQRRCDLMTTPRFA
jgi:hypothetical protein